MAYVVLARWTAKPEQEEAVAAALARLIEPSRAEPGNLVYQVHRDPGDRDAFDRLASRQREFFLTWEGGE